jgi:hypothetical protein
MLRRTLTALAVLASCMSTSATAEPRLELIHKRGFLHCGLNRPLPVR